jgi:FkbM family methyltransferase
LSWPDLREAAGLARSLAIYYGAPWRRRSLRRFYGHLIKPGDLVFDVGAHVGNRTRALHGLGARVVAIEPQPLFHRFLAATLPSDRIVLVKAALGASPGVATLNVSRRHPTVSTLSRQWIETVQAAEGFEHVRWDRQVEVDVTTLDALIAEFGAPAFCKIDVEGMEAEILKGLSTPLPLIAFEYLPAALPIAQACLDRLGALGPHEFNLVIGERQALALPEWLDAEAFTSALRDAAAGGRSGDVYARPARRSLAP